MVGSVVDGAVEDVVVACAVVEVEAGATVVVEESGGAVVVTTESLLVPPDSGGRLGRRCSCLGSSVNFGVVAPKEQECDETSENSSGSQHCPEGNGTDTGSCSTR